MEKQAINEEMKVHEQWYKEAKNVNLETLPAFLNHLMGDYRHDYGTICHALTAGSIATMWAMDKHEQGGITGFQASCIMWEFIRNWMSYESSLKLVKYDDMLYPQYEGKFAKTISKSVFEDLQKKAKKNLEESEFVHAAVKAHWESIVNGIVPFGYEIKED